MLLSPGLRVLIVDDHAVIRHGLRVILIEAAHTTLVGEARDGREALEKGLAEQWDVILLDISMPDLNGLEVLRRLKAARPEACVVMLSMHANGNYVRGALQAGAAGYLTKEAAPEELIRAIGVVLGGGRYLSDSVSELQ